MQPNPILNLIPIAVIFLIFYFLLIRPQQKQVKAHDKMLEDLKKGDLVQVNGGLVFKADSWQGTDPALPGSEVTVVVPDSYPCTACQVSHKSSSRVGQEHLAKYQEEQRLQSVIDNVEPVTGAAGMGRG